MRPQIKTVLTGGVVQARSYELVGPSSDVVLEKITDIAFIAVNGIDPVMGATVHDERKASVNSHAWRGVPYVRPSSPARAKSGAGHSRT
jgi:DeoR family transcriptional regulator of aga operon